MHFDLRPCCGHDLPYEPRVSSVTITSIIILFASITVWQSSTDPPVGLFPLASQDAHVSESFHRAHACKAIHQTGGG
jgi:hypothetical protein